MTFTNIFGQTFDRNPNLRDINFTVTETTLILNKLKSTSFTADEQMYLVGPIESKLKLQVSEFLLAELKFIREICCEYPDILARITNVLAT